MLYTRETCCSSDSQITNEKVPQHEMPSTKQILQNTNAFSIGYSDEVHGQEVVSQQIYGVDKRKKDLFDKFEEQGMIKILKQKRCRAMDENRKLRRSKLAAKKRQIVREKDSKQLEVREFCSEQIEDTPPKLSKEERHQVIQVIQEKAQIVQICEKIKSAEDQEKQWCGILQLEQYLTACETGNTTQAQVECKIFEILENSIFHSLLDLLQFSSLSNKQNIICILTNLALAGKREMRKMVSSGIITAMTAQLDLDKKDTSIDLVIGSLQTLGNIASTDIEYRDTIIDRDPLIFHKVFRAKTRVLENVTDIDLRQKQQQLNNEIVFFVSSMITKRSCLFINDHSIIEGYLTAQSLICTCLREFQFEDGFHYEHGLQTGQAVLNSDANDYLAVIVKSFNGFSQINVQSQQSFVAGTSQIEWDNLIQQDLLIQKLDGMVLTHNLYLHLMSILQNSQNQIVIENTWAFIGFLCSGVYNPQHVANFVENTYVNLLDILVSHIQSWTQRDQTSVGTLKNCLFTLSNILTEKSIYLEQVLKTDLFREISNIFEAILARQLHKGTANFEYAVFRNEDDQTLLMVKNEIIYCVGNCILSIQDALIGHGLCLLRQVVDQGAISVLTKALDFRQAPTQPLGIKVALDGLFRYFKVFQRVQRPDTDKDVKDMYGTDLAIILDDFEVNLRGIDILEQCQYHYDEEVFKMAKKILLRFFEPESDDDPLVQYLESLECQNIRFGPPDFSRLPSTLEVSEQTVVMSSIQSPEEEQEDM